MILHAKGELRWPRKRRINSRATCGSSNTYVAIQTVEAYLISAKSVSNQEASEKTSTAKFEGCPTATGTTGGARVSSCTLRLVGDICVTRSSGTLGAFLCLTPAPTPTMSFAPFLSTFVARTANLHGPFVVTQRAWTATVNDAFTNLAAAHGFSNKEVSDPISCKQRGKSARAEIARQVADYTSRAGCG